MKKEEINVEEFLKKQELLQKQIFNVDDLCEYTGFSKSYVYKLCHRNILPYYCPNGKLNFFKRSEIDSWLLRNKRLSREEIDVIVSQHQKKKQ